MQNLLFEIRVITAFLWVYTGSFRVIYLVQIWDLPFKCLILSLQWLIYPFYNVQLVSKLFDFLILLQYIILVSMEGLIIFVGRTPFKGFSPEWELVDSAGTCFGLLGLKFDFDIGKGIRFFYGLFGLFHIQIYQSIKLNFNWFMNFKIW